MKHRYFVTGIGTGIGKTIVSAVLTEKLGADYWKPIQSGDLIQSDSMTIKEMVANTSCIIHPETYRLNHPLSPHLSAKMDKVEIDLNNFKLPQTNKNLIVEGAGGLMVPLNNKQLIIDLIKQLDLEVIVLSQHYLGSINHTLLTILTLQQHGIKIKGIIFNGNSNQESQDYILQYTQIKHLVNIPLMKEISKIQIANAGENLML